MFNTLEHLHMFHIYIYITHLKLYIHVFPHVRGAHDLPHLAPPNVERFLIIRDSLGCNTHTAEHLEGNCWYRLWIWIYLQKWVVIISDLPRHILNDFTTCITAVLPIPYLILLPPVFFHALHFRAHDSLLLHIRNHFHSIFAICLSCRKSCLPSLYAISHKGTLLVATQLDCGHSVGWGLVNMLTYPIGIGASC